LPECDSIQASEKLWGAAAEMVEAVAVSLGLELRCHEEFEISYPMVKIQT
jgi:hypothetical protein